MRIILEKIVSKYYYYSLAICNTVHRKILNKRIKLFIFVLLSPIIIIKRFFGAVSDMILIIRTNHVKKAEKRRCFKYDLAIVAIAKNESQYIDEWLAYHKLVGVNKVFLYDNNSTDNLENTIKPYIVSGFVEYCKYPGEGMQMKAYNDAIDKYKDIVKYMAIIDCDEFLVSKNEEENLLPIITKLFEKYSGAGGIGVSWCVYGSAGKDKKEFGLVTERFIRRGNQSEFPNVLYKTIINPRLVKSYVSPHFPIYKRGAHTVSPDGRRLYVLYNYDVCFDEIVCNHYFCKSKEEFVQKISRGLADKPGVFRDMSVFDLYDKNDIEDKTMLKYTERIKQNML